MRTVWHFSNTTLRNPMRLADGLKLLKNTQYHGNLIGKENEQGYAIALYNAGIINLTDVDRDNSSMGRKWRAAFTQLGFLTYKPTVAGRSVVSDAVDTVGVEGVDPQNQFQVTPNGQRLISSDNVFVQQEAMLRALLAYELPSDIESDYAFEAFKPFVFILEVLNGLKVRDLKGLSKYEFVIVTKYHSHDRVDDAINHLISYREERSGFNGSKKDFDKSYLDRLYPDATDTAKGTYSKDYPDLIVRYSRFTGLFIMQGRRLALNPEKEELITDILAIEPNVISTNSMSEYIARLWNGAELPTDNSDVRLREVRRYLVKLGREQEITSLTTLSEDEIGVLRHELEEEYQKVREIEYADRQANEVDDIIFYLEEIRKRHPSADANIYDRPAFLEWTLWRAFLAINSLVNKPYESRRFRVDHEFYPLGCAPGGGPDLIFEFEDYILVVEVTLTQSSRQEAAEGESVRRHVAQVDYKNNPSNKPVYGLFIAEKIDNNTAEIFRIGVWYRDDTPHFLNIVPLTIEQFVVVLNGFNTQGVDKDKVRKILDTCLIPRNAHAPIWKQEINSIMNIL